MSADEYKAFLRDPNNFSVSFGDTAWKVGVIQYDGTFVPFTRVMAMAADNAEGRLFSPKPVITGNSSIFARGITMSGLIPLA